MKKVVLIILILLFGGALLIKTNYFRKPEQDLSKSTPQAVNEKKSELSHVREPMTIDTVLNGAKEIVKWESDQYSRATILWNTEEEELKLDGIGYLFGDEMGSTDLKEKHATLKIYLRDIGFEHDKFNVGSSAPGSERSILKLNDIGCELYIRDVELKGGTDMGILCTILPEEVISVKPVPMSEKIARSVAETSRCVEDGTLKENAFYNENSKTWWIDLNIDKQGCSPACVVYEDETVEINWRCTGLIPE